MPILATPSADAVLWAAVRSWTNAKHTGTNKTAASAVKAWAAAKGLK